MTQSAATAHGSMTEGTTAEVARATPRRRVSVAARHHATRAAMASAASVGGQLIKAVAAAAIPDVGGATLGKAVTS